MRSISKMGFKNFRVFEKNEFDLKPITLITGANSSGKSTLFKSLLLLKYNAQKNGNIENLTLSNKPYFLGTFETTKSSKSEDDFFSFIFAFDVLPFKLDEYTFDFKVEYRYAQSSENAKLSNIIISSENRDFINVSVDTYTETIVDENEIINLLQDYNKIIELLNNKLLIEFQDRVNDNKNQKLSIEGIQSDYTDFSYSENSAIELIVNNKSDIYFEQPKHKFIDEIGFKVEKIRDNTYLDFLGEKSEGQNGLNDIAQTIISSDVVLGKRKFKQIYKDEDIYDRLSRDAISRLFGATNSILMPNENIKAFIDYVIYFSERIIPNITNKLINRLKSIEYLSSNRSRLSRYYQNTNETSEFDDIVYEYTQSNFETNLPEFPEENEVDFIDKWLQKFDIGEKLVIERAEGILSFVYIENNRLKRNIADFGFGIIQLIPILLKIATIGKRKNEGGTILLIEEPEANLHPKFQSILTELFIEASNAYNIHFIIETHSEYLIRELQLQVANNLITSDSVAIFYINKNFTNHENQIETVKIEENGAIEFEKFGDEFYKYTENQELNLLNINRTTFIERFEALKQSNEDNDNKIKELELQIDTFLNKLNISIYRAILNTRFDTTKFLPISLDYLTSGQYLFNTMDITDDFSPVIIQYGRAIENELKDIFMSIDCTKKWMLGNMQDLLVAYKTNRRRSITRIPSLHFELTNRFYNPLDLKIELLDDLRLERNSAGHAGAIKTQREAFEYIEKVNEFLDKWIGEKK